MRVWVGGVGSPQRMRCFIWEIGERRERAYAALEVPRSDTDDVCGWMLVCQWRREEDEGERSDVGREWCWTGCGVEGAVQ